MAEPKKTKGGGKDDGGRSKRLTPEEMAQLAEEQPMSGLIPAMIEQDRLDGLPEDHQPYHEPDDDEDNGDSDLQDADSSSQTELSDDESVEEPDSDDREMNLAYGPEASDPGTVSGDQGSVPMDQEAPPADQDTSPQLEPAVLNGLVDEVNNADADGDNKRLAVAYRIRRDCFGNDIRLMESRSHYKSVKYTTLVTHPRTRPDESTIRGWIYGSLVDEHLRNHNIVVDPPLTISILILLYRTKDPSLWRELAPQVAGMKVKDAKDHIKARTGKQKTESTSDMILRQLRSPLRAMQDEEFVSLISDPDTLAARLDEDEMHRILGEFVNIRKPVEDFLALVATLQSILNELSRSRAA
jgi:hypothetical protein